MERNTARQEKVEKWYRKRTEVIQFFSKNQVFTIYNSRNYM